MGSPELAQYADFYASQTARSVLTDNLEIRRDISERLHQLTSEPEGVTYRDVTANGVPALLVMPADSSADHILLHSHSGGSVTSSMFQERKAAGHLVPAPGVVAACATVWSSTTGRPRRRAVVSCSGAVRARRSSSVSTRAGTARCGECSKRSVIR